MEFASAQTRDKACPSPMGAAVGCDALCASPAEAASLSADCYARREVYIRFSRRRREEREERYELYPAHKPHHDSVLTLTTGTTIL